MIQTAKISENLKQEVLKAIQNQNFEFEQNFEGDRFSSSNDRREIESENFNIVVELTETVRWSSFRDYEFEELQLTDLIVTDEEGENYANDFTDEEILNLIN